MIYQTFKEELIKELEFTRDRLVVQNRQDRPESIFCIKDKNDELYSKIIEEFEKVAIRKVEYLVASLCKSKGIPNMLEVLGDPSTRFDMAAEINGESKYIEFKSIFDVDRIRKMVSGANRDVLVVALLKDNLSSRRMISQIEPQFVNASPKVEFVLFEDFLGLLFGEEERNAFLEEMSNFKEEMHNALGYQITEMCSPHNLAKLKEELENDIKNLDYGRIKKEISDELKNNDKFKDLNSRNFQLIENVFLNYKNYEVLLGNSDFAESLATSEWLYKKYFAFGELDNTYIVAGYLKSIEQLLWDIIFIIGKGRQIGSKKITISESNLNEIDRTLGSLQYFLNSYENDRFFLDAFMNSKHFVMQFLNEIIDYWRIQYRNGYFHKDNLSDKTKIEAIREKTFFLYFLILGSIKLDNFAKKKLL